MEHLALEVFDLTGSGSKFANLPKNTTIRIRRTSQVFGSGAVFTHEIQLNIHANLHLFGTSGEIHGSRLHEQINKRKARIWAEGLPLYLGYLRLSDEVEVDGDGNVGVSFESGQHTFDEMIEGAKANQVPMMSDVLIGMALWRKRKASCTVQLTASATLSNDETASPASKDYPYIYQGTEPHEGTIGSHIGFSADGEIEGESVQQYPRMVFPRGEFHVVSSSATVSEHSGKLGGTRSGEQSGDSTTETIDCINTDYPYDDAHPYCNVALCYQKYGYTRKQKDDSEMDDYGSEPEAQRGYETMPANRVNSAPNFFVLYWLKALMKHLGIYVEENQMMDVEDLRRLFFVNTNCAYKEPEKLRTGTVDSRYGKYKFPAGVAATGTQGVGGHQGYRRYNDRLVPEYYGERSVASEVAGTKVYKYKRGENINIEESKFSVVDLVGADAPDYDHSYLDPSKVPSIKELKVSIATVEDWDGSDKSRYEQDNSYLHGAIATSECFPNVDISEVIHGLESGFGVRLLFSDDYQRVRIVLLRNLFRSTDVQTIQCEILGGDVKEENCIRGFRMTYGDSEDTAFYYKGFADKLPHKKPYFVDDSDTHDYSHWNLNADYAGLIDKVSAFDKTCYVTPENGNAYIIKIDKDAKRYDDLHPSLFPCADFMDAEDGDCTGEEATIETINVGFAPAVMNDVNFENERGSDGNKTQRFALFVDQTMRPRRPALVDGTDYDDPEADYDIYDGLYAKVKNDKGEDTNEYVNSKMMAGDGIVKPGEFAIRSDMYNKLTGLRVNLIYHTLKSGTSTGGQQPPEAVKWSLSFSINGYINEGYRLYLQDNYEPNDEGISPIETKDWGLTLGIMRGSGSDMHVEYTADTIENEDPMNDTWERIAGSSVTAHPDTCDNYGNLWDYNGSDGMTLHCYTSAEAINAMQSMWKNSNINLVYSNGSTQRNVDTYINSAAIQTVDGISLLFATTLNGGTTLYTGKIKDYKKRFAGMSAADMYEADKKENGGFGILIEVGSSTERMRTLLALQKLAFGNGSPVIIDGGENGIGVKEGRFSLKLRAEKPNPYFDPKQEESASNRRYLEITNDSLKGRGLCDQFYKEYSYWIRNARIVKRTVRMELAQLLTIDDTVRVKVGDVTGFVKEMEYDIGMQTGLGIVTMDIMYI